VTNEDLIFHLTSKKSARFNIIHTSLSKLNLTYAVNVVVSGEAVITGMIAASDALYITQLAGGLGRVLRVDWNDRANM
jgi:hypothetical protein